MNFWTRVRLPSNPYLKKRVVTRFLHNKDVWHEKGIGYETICITFIDICYGCRGVL